MFQVFEPTLPDLLRVVTLVKEENRTSEQAFLVLITVGPPEGNIAAAIRETPSSQDNYDYRLTAPIDRSFITLQFPPQVQSIPFNFYINGDDIREGTEAFQARSESSTSGGNVPVFQPPIGGMVHQNTEIQIIDNDGKSLAAGLGRPSHTCQPSRLQGQSLKLN